MQRREWRGRLRQHGVAQVDALSQLKSDPDGVDTYFELQSDLAQLSASIHSSRAIIADPTEVQLASAFDQSSSVLGKRPASGARIQDDDIDRSISAFLTLHRVTAERSCEILDAWSTNGPAGSAKELKAVNRAAGEQVRASLSQPESRERLLKRTRIWRGADKLGEEGGTAASTTNEPDENVFDDTDFYSALLRELIESKGEGAGGSDGMAGVPIRTKGPKRAVDTRASKGRRLKYEVHEKIANFMPPIPSETWSEEQRARLFAQLSASTSTTFSAAAGEDAGERSATSSKNSLAQVDLAGLRVFG